MATDFGESNFNRILVYAGILPGTAMKHLQIARELIGLPIHEFMHALKENGYYVGLGHQDLEKLLAPSDIVTSAWGEKEPGDEATRFFVYISAERRQNEKKTS